MCEKWNVDLNFRAAFRGNCNRIIERNHRTVKRIAGRSDISIQDAGFDQFLLIREVCRGRVDIIYVYYRLTNPLEVHLFAR